MPVDLEVPVRVGGEPVVPVAVEDDGRVVADAALAEDPLERRLADEVALDRVLQVLAPVELDRAADVPLLVEVGVLVHLGEDEPLAVEAVCQPAGRDQHRLRVTVLHHLSSLRLPSRPAWTPAITAL